MLTNKQPWQNRIVKYGEAPASSFLANPNNWRIHPIRQQNAVDDALDTVGWVDSVKVNLRTSPEWPEGERGVETMVDGHMRVTLALRRGDNTPVPVVYLDLTPDEEAFTLATLDPLAALAVTDAPKFAALAEMAKTSNEAMVAAMRGAKFEHRETLLGLGSGGDSGSGGESDKKSLGEGEGGNKAKKQEVSTPETRQKYPLAIVLDRSDNERWRAFAGKRTDSAAFREALDLIEASMEDQSD